MTKVFITYFLSLLRYPMISIMGGGGLREFEDDTQGSRVQRLGEQQTLQEVSRMWVIIMFLIRVWMFFRHSPVLWRGLGLWRQGLSGLVWISLFLFILLFDCCTAQPHVYCMYTNYFLIDKHG